MSKSKFKFYLPNDVSFTYFWHFNDELQAVKVVYIFWDTLCFLISTQWCTLEVIFLSETFQFRFPRGFLASFEITFAWNGAADILKEHNSMKV